MKVVIKNLKKEAKILQCRGLIEKKLASAQGHLVFLFLTVSDITNY
jgi:hypothetical protein